MAKFLVNPDNLKSRESDFALCAKELRKIADSVKTCQMNLGFSSGSSLKIQASLLSRYNDLLEEAARMDTFKEAILKVASYYDSTEVRILNNLSGNNTGWEEASASEDVYADRQGTDKRSGWRKFWDWVFGKDVDTSYTATTSAQEAAADKAFQERIARLTSKDKYSQAHWASASVDERKKILQDYMNDVAAIMGVDVKSKINFFNSPRNSDGTITMGQYVHSGRSVEINEAVLAGASSYSLISTIVHELRHAYQHSAVDNPDKFQVSKETIDSWKESFRTYREEANKGYESYRKIIVEQDARAFAKQS